MEQILHTEGNGTESTAGSEPGVVRGLLAQAGVASRLGEETLRDFLSCSMRDPGKLGIVPVI